MLAGDHAVEVASDPHDARHGTVGPLQHGVVVGVDRDVGVHVAVAGMHVQRHPDAAMQYPLVDGREVREQRREGAAREDALHFRAHLALPGNAHGVVLHHVEQACRGFAGHAAANDVAHLAEAHVVDLAEGLREGQVEVRREPMPAPAAGGQHRSCHRRTVREDVVVRQAVHIRIASLADLRLAGEVGVQFIEELQLVLDRQLDVDAFDGVGVFAQALERNHDVLVHLEGVGVPGDRGGARPVAPESLASLRAHGDEAFAGAGVGNTHDFGCAKGHCVLVVAGDVAEQHHLGQRAALRLGGVADGLQVALIEMLEAGQLHAAPPAFALEVVADLDDGRDRLACLAEEFEADGAHVRRHAVQDPARRRDDPVATFLLHARQSAEELVGDVLAEAELAEATSIDFEPFRAQHARAFGLVASVLPGEVEDGFVDFVDLAEVVPDPRDLEPVAVWVDHAPPRKVVERSAPQHGLLAARVHGDVAAHDGGVGGRRVDGEYESCLLRSLLDSTRDDAGLGQQRRHRSIHTGQLDVLDGIDAFELFRVDHGGERRERHAAAGVTRAASARNHGEAGLDAGADQPGDFVLLIGCQHHERNLDAPVGGVRGVRDARERIEADVVAAGVAAERPPRLAPQTVDGGERLLEVRHCAACSFEQAADLGIALAVPALAPLVDLVEAVVQGADQHPAAFRVVEQVLLEVRVAVHDPDVAEHLIEHPRGAARPPLGAQLVEHPPAFVAEQADDDFPIRERRVVVGDLAQPGRRIERVTGLGRDGGSRRVRNGVHGAAGIQRWDGVIVARPGGIGYWGNCPGLTQASRLVARSRASGRRPAEALR